MRCFFQVDLEYPDELHSLHKDYPFAPEKIKVAKETLSEYQLQILDDNNFSFGQNEKLVTNVGNKRKCNFRYQNFI